MVVIPREICREEKKAFAYEWMVRNDRGAYSSTSIAGALTRREHGLLVAKLDEDALPQVLLAKVDEEVEVERQLYKLGANEYQGGVISPDGFLYLQQVAFDGVTATFQYEAGRFRLEKMIWMDADKNTTYVRYTSLGQSAPLRLTLVPMCDGRSIEALTHGNPQWHLDVTRDERGIRVQPNESSPAYSIFVDCDAIYTPLDLWYWRFQLRATENAQCDLFVPGLFRAELKPGDTITMIVSTEESDLLDLNTQAALERAQTRTANAPLPPADQFTPATFRV